MNRLSSLVVCVFVLVVVYASPVLGDGCFILPVGSAADLSQTRQEAVLAFHDTSVTYVMRTMYTGSPNDFAWVIPVPATPNDVVDHADGALFDELDESTRPRFFTIGAVSRGCGCSADLAGGTSGTSLVTVEASGTAGVFDWAALTSTGADALLGWLNLNGYAVPASAQPFLQTYILQGMHFLAVRIGRPQDLLADAQGQVEIPPLQFTCQTARRYYPMVISRISAASQTEVLLYLIAEHRAEATNVPNGEIPRGDVVRDPNSPSNTNYEALFAAQIAALGGLALITEYAGLLDHLPYNYSSSYNATGDVAAAWPNMPQELRDPNDGFRSGLFLTRMRTLLPPERMTVDFEFDAAAADTTVSSEFWISDANQTAAASVFGPPLAVLGAYALCCAAVRHRRGRRPPPPT